MKNQTYDKAMPIKAVWPNSVTTIVQAAMIAALYVVLTILANALGQSTPIMPFRSVFPKPLPFCLILPPPLCRGCLSAA